MRYSRSEKLEIIRLVEQSELPVKRTLAELQVSRASFYRWYRAYEATGTAGLERRSSPRRQFWNKVPEQERQRVVEVALAEPELSPRELAWRITDREGWFISESSVYRILKAFDLVTSPHHIVLSAADRFAQPTRRVHEMWQTDFTYLKITGWGWYYLGTILDDFSRYVICWRLFTTMSSDDVKELLDEAVALTGVTGVPVRYRPRLLSDNGPCYMAKGLAEWMEANDMQHVRGKPYHPQTQGKIERYHRTMKNVVKLENYWLPGDLKRKLASFVTWYNTQRYHESLQNLTPQDVYVGRGREIQVQRELLKMQTLRARRCYNLGHRDREKRLIRPDALRESVY